MPIEKSMRKLSDYQSGDYKAYRIYLDDSSDSTSNENSINEVLIKTLLEKDFNTLKAAGKLYTAVIENGVATFSRLPSNAVYNPTGTYFVDYNGKKAVVTSETNRFINIPTGGRFLEKDIEIEKIPRAIFSNNSGIFSCMNGGYIPKGEVVIGLGQVNDPKIEKFLYDDKEDKSVTISQGTYYSKSSTYNNNGLTISTTLYVDKDPLNSVWNYTVNEPVIVNVSQPGYFSVGEVKSAEGLIDINFDLDINLNPGSATVVNTQPDNSNKIYTDTITIGKSSISLEKKEDKNLESAAINTSVNFSTKDYFIQSGTTSYPLTLSAIIDSASYTLDYKNTITANATDGIINKDNLENNTNNTNITISKNLSKTNFTTTEGSETVYLKASSIGADNSSITAERTYLKPGGSLLISPGYYGSYRRIYSDDESGALGTLDPLGSVTLGSTTNTSTLGTITYNTSSSDYTIPITIKATQANVTADDEGWANQGNTITLNDFNIDGSVKISKAQFAHKTNPSFSVTTKPSVTVEAASTDMSLVDSNGYKITLTSTPSDGTVKIGKGVYKVSSTGYTEANTEITDASTFNKTVGVDTTIPTEILVKKGSVSSSVSGTNPTFTPTLSVSGVKANYGFTTTTPSGTNGTNYLTLTPGGSSDSQTFSSSMTFDSGYIKSAGTAGTVDVSASKGTATPEYIPIVTPAFSGGEITASANLNDTQTNATLESTDNSGIEISATPSASSTAITYNGNFKGLIGIASGTQAKEGETTPVEANSAVKYLKSFTLPKGKILSGTLSDASQADSNGLTITNGKHRTISINGGGDKGVKINGANGKTAIVDETTVTDANGDLITTTLSSTGLVTTAPSVTIGGTTNMETSTSGTYYFTRTGTVSSGTVQTTHKADNAGWTTTTTSTNGGTVSVTPTKTDDATIYIPTGEAVVSTEGGSIELEVVNDDLPDAVIGDGNTAEDERYHITVKEYDNTTTIPYILTLKEGYIPEETTHSSLDAILHPINIYLKKGKVFANINYGINENVFDVTTSGTSSNRYLKGRVKYNGISRGNSGFTNGIIDINDIDVWSDEPITATSVSSGRVGVALNCTGTYDSIDNYYYEEVSVYPKMARNLYIDDNYLYANTPGWVYVSSSSGIYTIGDINHTLSLSGKAYVRTSGSYTEIDLEDTYIYETNTPDQIWIGINVNTNGTVSYVSTSGSKITKSNSTTINGIAYDYIYTAAVGDISGSITVQTSKSVTSGGETLTIKKSSTIEFDIGISRIEPPDKD